jgi:hypothetical protein
VLPPLGGVESRGWEGFEQGGLKKK